MTLPKMSATNPLNAWGRARKQPQPQRPKSRHEMDPLSRAQAEDEYAEAWEDWWEEYREGWQTTSIALVVAQRIAEKLWDPGFASGGIYRGMVGYGKRALARAKSQGIVPPERKFFTEAEVEEIEVYAQAWVDANVPTSG